MNDKERLTQSKQMVELLKKGNEREPIFSSLEIYLMNWLIEQAKRVQELERVNGNLKFNIDTALDHSEKHRLENKRYREGIKEAIEMSSCCGLTAGSMLSELLEGEE